MGYRDRAVEQENLNEFSSLTMIGLISAFLLPSFSLGNEWDEVQKILHGTQEIVVLDGTKKSSVRYAGTERPVYGDWLVRHFLSDPENFNPFTSSDASVSSVQNYIFEPLLSVDRDPPYALKGLIAERYPEVGDDYLEYRFHIRKGVHFSDGHPLTVDDVLFSMKVIQHPEVLAPHLRNYYASVSDARIEGESLITFVCREPYFMNDLMLGRFSIIPKHFYDADGLLNEISLRSLIDGSWEKNDRVQAARTFAQRFNQNFNRAIVGSGPYVVENFERDVVTQQKVVLTRSPTYWANETEIVPASGYVDKIVFKIINNTDAAFIELTNGQIDMYNLQPLEFKEKSWTPEFQQRYMKAINYSGGFNYIGWNNAHPLFSDKRVRQAMSYLTNRKSMIDNLMFGLGESVVGPIHKFRPEYNHDLEPYGFDPERAIDLLEEAGWEDADEDGILDKTIGGKRIRFEFEFLVNSGNQIRKDIALVLQSELQDVGINCQVRELDWSIFLQRVRSRDFAAMTLGWTGQVRFPPDGYQIWHSSQIESGSNYVGFKNNEVDGILEAYRREFDPDKRIVMYHRLQAILHEEQPYTFLWKSRNAIAYSRRYRGVSWYPGGDRSSLAENSLNWWVSKESQRY